MDFTYGFTPATEVSIYIFDRSIPCVTEIKGYILTVTLNYISLNSAKDGTGIITIYPWHSIEKIVISK